MASALAEEADKWIAEAEADKRLHEVWLRDYYRYCLPWRRRPGDYSQTQPIHDQDELFDSTAIETGSDFAADMQATFTPNEKNWLNVEPATALGGPQLAQLKAPLKQYENAVFAEIRRSNFNEASQECYPDLGAGTMAVCIQSLNINEKIHCQAVSITDLLIVRGIYGGVDFKARCLEIKYTQLPAAYPNVKWPTGLLGKINGNDTSRAKVKECFWRLYDKPGIERWQYVLLVDKEEVDAEIQEGEGSCSLIVARWRTDSTTAWGIGNGYTILPTIKTLDQLKWMLLKAGNLANDPIVTYDDDGIINVENGVTPGTWIPKAKGSEVEVIESGAKFDVGFFQAADMQADIRRAYFQDKPEQTGKTPPTATQWLDENAQIDKRMGAPIGRLVSEWQIPVFARFAYLMQQRGILPAVRLGAQEIAVRPQSPLIRSQKHEDVVVANNFLNILLATFGEEGLNLLVKQLETAENIKQRIGDDVVELRSQQEIQQLTAAAAQAAQELQPQGGQPQ